VEPTDRLESWKEIAAYLNRDVRTVQRWEASEELPVHRHQHKKRGSVYALRSELDTWRDSRRAELFEPAAEVPASPVVELRPVPRLAWAAAIVVVAAAAIGLAAWVRASAPTGVLLDPPGDAPRLFGEVLREGGRPQRIQLPGEVGDLALSPDGTTLYAAVCGSGVSAVHAVDLASRAIAWSVEGVAGCTRLVLSPRGERLLVADAPDILLVDTRTRAVERVVTPAATISDIVLTADGRTLYAAAAFGGLLAVDTGRRNVTTISRLPCPMQVALSPAGDRLYVNYQCGGPGGRRGHDSIEVLDTRTHQAVAVIKDLPNVGGDLAVSPDGAYLWADGFDACRNDIYDHAGCPEGPGSVVNVIRTADYTLVRSLRIGPSDSYNLLVSPTPDARRIVIGRLRITSVDATNLSPAESVPGPLHGAPVYDRRGTVAYAAIGNPGEVAILPIAQHPAPPPGLTARWTMDGHGGDAVADNDLAVTPAAFAAGRIGLSIRPDPRQPLRLDAPPNLFIDRGAATAMAWVNVDEAPPDRAMTILQYAAEGAGTSQGWQVQRLPGGRAAACLSVVDDDCRPGMPSFLEGATVLTPATWHHVAMVRAGQEVSLYVDGRLEATGAAPRSQPVLSPRWLRVGSSEASATPFVGRVDEVEVYGRPLSSEEIRNRMK